VCVCVRVRVCVCVCVCVCVGGAQSLIIIGKIRQYQIYGDE